MVLNKPQTSVEKATIPTTTRLGYVHLTVNSLEREIMFYTQVLGFTLHSREDRGRTRHEGRNLAAP